MFSCCKSQREMIFDNAVPLQLTEQGQLILQGLYRLQKFSCRGQLNLSCLQRGNLFSMLFILSAEDAGYGREFSEKETINFCCYSTNCLAFLLKVPAGSGYVDCVTAHFSKLCFLPLDNQKRVANWKVTRTTHTSLSNSPL